MPKIQTNSPQLLLDFDYMQNQKVFLSGHPSHQPGKRNLEVFVRISIPLAKKGILIGIVMTWIRAIGELGATLMLAYNPHTISIQIYEDNALGGLSQAIPGIILSILLSIVLVIVYSIIVKKSSSDTRKNNRIFSFGDPWWRN